MDYHFFDSQFVFRFSVGSLILSTDVSTLVSPSIFVLLYDLQDFLYV